MAFEAFNKRFLLYTTYASRANRGGGFRFARIYDNYMTDTQALDGNDAEAQSHDIQQLDRERRNEIPLAYQTAPDGITAVTNFLASAALCQSCEAIPVIRLMRSMDGNQQAHAGSKTPTTPDECSMCQIFNEQGITSSDRTVRPQVNSWIYFQLLNDWLDKCHLKHNHHPPPLSTRQNRIKPGDVASGRMPAAPLRLIDVQANPLQIVRHETESYYVALSHRWEDPEKDAVHDFWKGQQPNLGNDQPNANSPVELILDPRLAKFADAVTVTRRLGMRQAYCVVTVVWSDPTRGFLSPRDDNDNNNNNNNNTRLLRLPDGVKESSLRIVSGEREKDRADFERDVLRSEWNTRGWTFQERALACHTIYFAENHVYWECGESTVSGTQAGSFRLEGQTPYSDSQFPQLPANIGPNVRCLDVELVKTIYKDYSTRHLTRATDQPVAIMGLEYRLAVRYLCYSVFGVLLPNATNSSRARDTCLHETLAWKPQEGGGLVDIIWGDGNDTVSLDKRAPSWSWMSRSGKINYVDIGEPADFHPAELGFKYEVLAETPGTKQLQLRAQLRRKRLDEASTVVDGEVFAVRGGGRERVGKLSYDTGRTDSKAYGRDDELCVVEIGSSTHFGDSKDVQVCDGDKCLVLLVEKKPLQGATPRHENGEYYQRVGWAIFEKGWLSSQTKDDDTTSVV